MLQPIKLPCQCGESVEVKVANPPRIMNMESVSIIAIEHQGQVVCSKCGMVLVVAVGAVPGVAFALVPIPPEKQQSVIIPGNSLTH